MTDDGLPATVAGDDHYVDLMVLPPGRMVGRYEIRSVLGQGSFGITYKARDSQLGRDVALKEYLPAALAVRTDGTTVRPRSTQAAADFTWGRDRFVAEGRTIASLHEAPGIVRVLDFLEANGTAYIVMELVRGETLADRLRSGPLDATMVSQILTDLLLGLEQVHAAGFLHRDIKPGNILLDRRGTPTLIDFGASREAMAERTAALTAIFTPGYAAVEQVTTARQGPWTDIYGVAATLYHAIVGKPPPNSIDRMIEDTCIPLSQLAPAGYPRVLLAGIDAGLAVRVASRPQSIADWRALLNGFATPADATIALPSIATQEPEPATVPPGSPSSSPSAPSLRRRTALWGAAVLVVVLLLAGGSYFAFFQLSPEKEVERARERLAAAEQAAKRQANDGAKAIAEAAGEQAAAQASAQQAQTAQQQREAEEAKQKADAEAQQRQQAEAAERARALKEIQEAQDRLAAAESARKQAEEEAARVKAQADAAAKQQADADAAKRKVEEDAAASKKSDDDQRKASEAAEGALRLSHVDRQRIQVSLTALGFDTRGADGAFGPRTREMIGNWQKRQNQPPTGFLSGAQQQALLREAAPAVARFDDERKKADEAKKKAEDEAQSKAPQQPAPTAPPAASPLAQPAGARDGIWFGAVDCKQAGRMSVQGNVANGNGRLAGVNITASLSISGAGASVNVVSQIPSGPNGTLSGEVRGRSVFAKGVLQRAAGGLDECTASLVGP